MNERLVAPPRPDDVTARVYPLAGWSTLRSANVAIPSTACTVVVPERVAPPGLALSATVTAFVAPGTVTPRRSWIATRSAGDIAAPTATLSGGCVAKPSRLGGPTTPAGDQLGCCAPAALVVSSVGSDPSAPIT